MPNEAPEPWLKPAEAAVILQTDMKGIHVLWRPRGDEDFARAKIARNCSTSLRVKHHP